MAAAGAALIRNNAEVHAFNLMRVFHSGLCDAVSRYVKRRLTKQLPPVQHENPLRTGRTETTRQPKTPVHTDVHGTTRQELACCAGQSDVVSNSNRACNGCLSTRGRDGTDHDRPGVSPTSLHPAALTLAPFSLARMYVPIRL